MGECNFVNHRGKQILVLDCSKCQPGDYDPIIKECAMLVQAQPMKSVRTVTVAGDGRFDTDTLKKLQELTKDNEPFVVASAVVGLTGLQRIVLNAVSAFSGRTFHQFDTLDQALDFLADH